jgi:Protein of unknown function (DUF533)
MDPIDILGSLLGGGKRGGGGLGGQILTQILKGGGAAERSSAPAPSPSSRPQPGRPFDIQQEASELEDLLNVAHERQTQRQAQPQSPSRPAPVANSSQPSAPFSFPSARTQAPPPPRRNPGPADYRKNTQQANEDALVLIRAMINAAKSDGDISEAEQRSILERIGNPTQDIVNFLRQEFSQPLDAREFAWSVPIGMEQKVYGMSLASIELDVNEEATYLRDLAHGLRLSPEICNQIHKQFGAPEIY